MNRYFISTNKGWIVISQARKEWPSKEYEFSDKAQALMFLDMCRRDKDYHFDIREVK